MLGAGAETRSRRGGILWLSLPLRPIVDVASAHHNHRSTVGLTWTEAIRIFWHLRDAECRQMRDPRVESWQALLASKLTAVAIIPPL